jgi:hypothetical protein
MDLTRFTPEYIATATREELNAARFELDAPIKELQAVDTALRNRLVEMADEAQELKLLERDLTPEKRAAILSVIAPRLAKKRAAEARERAQGRDKATR